MRNGSEVEIHAKLKRSSRQVVTFKKSLVQSLTCARAQGLTRLLLPHFSLVRRHDLRRRDLHDIARVIHQEHHFLPGV